MVKYSTSVLAAANLLALAQALPTQPVCSAVYQVVYGHGFWVPEADLDPSWSEWKDPNASKTKTPVASTSTAWTEWADPTKTPGAKTTTTTSAAGWGNWESAPAPGKTTTTATTTKKGGEFYPTGSPSSTYEHPTTTGGPKPTSSATYTHHTTEETTKSTTSTTSTTTTTTTTEAPKPTATCPYYNEQFSKVDSVSVGGSCGSTYTVNCGARVNVPQDGSVNFWERTAGELIGSLAECVAICDENEKCHAAIWTDYTEAGSFDFKHCWQTDNLPQPSLFGGKGQYGQISYKNGGSSSCATSYINPPPH